MLRKMNVSEVTTGYTASDSRGRRLWPKENVTIGCTASEMIDVNASGT